MVIHLLDERGSLHLDDAVVEYFPEFGRNGKEGVTLRQILTHRAGHPGRAATCTSTSISSPTGSASSPLLCDAQPLSVPGRRLAYHALTGGLRSRRGRAARHREGHPPRPPRGHPRPARLRDVRLRRRPRRASARWRRTPSPASPPFPPQSWPLERALGLGMREATDAVERPPVPHRHRPLGQHHRHRERGVPLLPAPARTKGSSTASASSSAARCGARCGAVVPRDRLVPRHARPLRHGLHAGRATLHALRAQYAEARSGTSGSPTSSRGPIRSGEISVGLMTSGKPFITPGQIAWLRVARTISRVCARPA